MKFILSIMLVLVTLAAEAKISAKSYIVMDMDGLVLLAENADEQRSIASITKLMTSERNAALEQDELITITKEDVKAGRMRNSPLRAGDQLTRAQLIELAMISSDNIAAIALGRSTQVELELPPHTQIVEASGLYAGNRSTAREIAEIARSLHQTQLAATSVKPNVKVKNRERWNTNPLIDKEGWNFYLSKTGFTKAAGGCLVVITELAGRLVTVVILGSTDSKQRWFDLVQIRQQFDDGYFYQPIKKYKRRSKRR